MRTNDLGAVFELRRGEVDRIAAQGAQYFKVSGEIEVSDTGEAVVAVNFPVQFVAKPHYSCGAELGPGQTTTVGQLPVGNICVLKWQETVRDDGSVIYSGASFGIVTAGLTGQVMIMQWHMEGIGLRNPVPDTDE